MKKFFFVAVDIEVHGGAEQNAISPKVPAIGAEERAILVQEQASKVQATEDGPVRGGVTTGASISR